jgi:hypothetical protein
VLRGRNLAARAGRRHRRAAAAVLALPLAAAAAAYAAEPGAPRSAGVVASPARAVAPCSWSYFGDPRSVTRGDLVFTGCISPTGSVKLERYDVLTGDRDLLTLWEGMERDDHNNPSLAFFRGRLFAFSAPHSGFRYPRDRRMYVRYRISKARYGYRGGFGRPRRVPLGPGCGLGYTYPNPVLAGRRLFLFLRGPCWLPYFTWTSNGTRWARPRTLVAAEPHRGRRSIRPYAKYAAGRDGSIHMVFSDGHPRSDPSSLYYVRLKGGRFLRADGSVVGTLHDLPLRLSRLDRVYRYRRSVGGAWPHDVAAGPDGRPVVLSTRLRRRRDTFVYSRWTGARWTDRRIAPAGRRIQGYPNGGGSLDHADPALVLITRRLGRVPRIELRRTADGGATWSTLRLTRRPRDYGMRPVFARGSWRRDRVVVAYVTGGGRDFRHFRTVVNMRVGAPPRR